MRTALCALLILAGWALRATPAATAAFLGAYLAGGTGPAITMLAALRRRQLSVDLLMILAALGAAYLGDWAEGAVLLFLFSLSIVGDALCGCGLSASPLLPFRTADLPQPML